MGDERILCPTCVEQNLRSVVYEGGSKVRLSYCPPFFDEQGRKHLHDTNYRPRSFRCSKGHSWVERKPNACWCGWVQELDENQFSTEPPTTGVSRPRAASMPDIIRAESPSEEPPAGYEVACEVDDEGFEFPIEPRTFSRIRPR